MADFSRRGQFNVMPITDQLTALQTAAAVALWYRYWFFTAYYAALTNNAFHWTVQTHKTEPSSAGLWTHLIHGSLGPKVSDPGETTSRSVEPFL